MVTDGERAEGEVLADIECKLMRLHQEAPCSLGPHISVSCPAVTILKFLMIFEQSVLHLHFALRFANYVAGLGLNLNIHGPPTPTFSCHTTFPPSC